MDDPDAILKRLLYRDGLILIVDKPAGLPVHPGPKGGPTLEDGLDALRFGLPDRPHLAHRLDRDTSGCLVLGRHKKALRRLGKLFEAGRVAKTYWAVVEGEPLEPTGTIDLPLAKLSTAKRGWWMTVDRENGRPAVTDYAVLAAAGGRTAIALRPKTGRTHQLRVHLAAIGCPILGDPVYGDKAPTAPMHLHARAIALPLYERRDPVSATAPVPARMTPALLACGMTAAVLEVPEEGGPQPRPTSGIGR